jgi:hypothetical protein
MLEDMKRRGLIEELNSPWSYPFILVGKKRKCGPPFLSGLQEVE